MAVNPFDQACRYLARGWGASLLSWLLGVPPEALRFVRWLDTRLTVPGQPERLGDTIAHLERLDQGGIPWAVPVEFQVEPDPLMFGRLLVYEGLTWLLEKPAALPGDRFQLQAVVVNLTGVGKSGRRMIWREGAGTVLEPIEWDLETKDAAAVLEQVANGQAPRSVLVWIPLMRQGSEPGIIQRWLELAAQEPDLQRKADLALVRVFAELAGGPGRLESCFGGIQRATVNGGQRMEGRGLGRSRARAAGGALWNAFRRGGGEDQRHPRARDFAALARLRGPCCDAGAVPARGWDLITEQALSWCWFACSRSCQGVRTCGIALWRDSKCESQR